MTRGAFNATCDLIGGPLTPMSGVVYATVPCRLVPQLEIVEIAPAGFFWLAWITMDAALPNAASLAVAGDVQTWNYGYADRIAVPSGSSPTWVVVAVQRVTPHHPTYVRALVALLPYPSPVPPGYGLVFGADIPAELPGYGLVFGADIPAELPGYGLVFGAETPAGDGYGLVFGVVTPTVFRYGLVFGGDGSDPIPVVGGASCLLATVIELGVLYSAEIPVGDTDFWFAITGGLAAIPADYRVTSTGFVGVDGSQGSILQGTCLDSAVRLTFESGFLTFATASGKANQLLILLGDPFGAGPFQVTFSVSLD